MHRADLLEVLPDVFMPVASIGHLIALKVLAGRHQDLTDLGYLISAATEADLGEARASVATIQERGFNREGHKAADQRRWQGSGAAPRFSAASGPFQPSVEDVS